MTLTELKEFIRSLGLNDNAKVSIVIGEVSTGNYATLKVTSDGEIVINSDDLTAILADLVVIGQEVYELENHTHNRERWFGKKGSQTATDWADQASLTPFRAVSGAGDFGGDVNDEALVLGTDDTPAISGMTLFDMREIMVEAASNSTEFILRVIYGTGTMADAESAGQYSDEMLTEARKGEPIDHVMPRLICGTDKVWIRVKNASDNAWIEFHVGIHEYER